MFLELITKLLIACLAVLSAILSERSPDVVYLDEVRSIGDGGSFSEGG